MRTFALILALLLTCAAHAQSPSPSPRPGVSLNDALAPFGIRVPGGERFNVQNSSARSAGSLSSQSVTAVQGPTRIELEITKPIARQNADSMRRSKMQLIERLYGPQVTPYQGSVTNTMVCAEDQKPQKRSLPVLGKIEDALISNASARYTFGVCDPKLVAQRGLVTSFYEERQKELVQIRVFQPVKEFSEKKVSALVSGIERRP